MRARLRAAMLWLLLRCCDALDIGIVVVLLDYNRYKTGVVSNLASRFPSHDNKELMLDVLRMAVHIVKGDITTGPVEKTR